MMRYENIINLVEKPMSGEWGKGLGEGDQEGIKIIRTTNFTNIGRLDLQDIVLRIIAHEKVEKKRLLYGDIIIEKSGGSPNQPVGRVVYFDIKNDVYLCNNFTSILRPKKNIVSKYLFYALFYKHITKRTLKYQNKTTGIINLQLQRYLEIEKILIPPRGMQKKIADVLDKAQELIDKRKEQIKKLDEFIQSVFFDMFGDPVINPKRWDYVELKELIKDVESRNMKKFPNVRIRYIDISSIDNKQNKIIKYNEYTGENAPSRAKQVVYKGDILLSTVRPNLRNVAMITEEYDNLIASTGFCVIRVNNRVNNKYLFEFVKTDYFTNKLVSLTVGANYPAVKNSDVYRQKILIPPIELQNKFAEIVEKAEKQKELLQKSLTEMENNFNSLMQKAFRGELF